MSRLRIQKDIEISLTPGSLITTDTVNEAKYTAPGTVNQILKIIGGFPTWSDNTESQVWADTAGVQVTNSTSVPHTAEAKRTGATLIGSVGAFATAQTKLQVDLGDIDIDDTLTTTGTITKGGVRYDHNFGTDNTFHGKLAGNLTLTGTSNVGDGANALTTLTSGSRNVAVGFNALTLATTSLDNTVVGANAGKAITTGGTNTLVGSDAGVAITTGTANTMSGYLSGFKVTTGLSNTFYGNLSGSRVQTNGTDLVAIGHQAIGRAVAFVTVTAGAFVVGTSYSIITIGTTDYTLIGAASNTVGITFVATGVGAGTGTASSLSTGISLTAVGAFALRNNTTGASNTAVGNSAMITNSIGSFNSAFGANSLNQNTTGGSNVAVGTSALRFNTTGGNNTAVGLNALNANTTSNNNTAVGFTALQLNTTGTDNCAFGAGALPTNVTGIQNSAFGTNALSISTSTGNSAFGFFSSYFLTTGSQNSSFGLNSLQKNQTGTRNVGVGLEGGSIIGSSDNVAVGANSIGNTGTVSAGAFIIGRTYSILVIGTTDFTLIGATANTAGLTFVATGVGAGTGAASTLASGGQNTAIGSLSLSNLSLGANNSAIGYNAGAAVSTFNNTTSVGSGSNATQSNQVMLGNVATTEVRSTGAFFGLSFTPSDERIKEDIQDLTPEIIEALLSVKPKLYFNTLTGKKDIGVVAQELPEILKPLFITVSDQYDRAATEKRIAETNGENTEPIYIKDFNHVDYQRLALMIALVK